MYINASSAKTNITKRKQPENNQLRADLIFYFGKMKQYYGPTISSVG